jgi:hypothetical protein
MFSARIPFWAQPTAAAIVTDPYWSNVTFLENFEAPQTAFVDGSTNNQAVTVSAGIPLPNYNSPFTSTSGSMYFNGSTSISVPTSSALYQFTGDFTVECWVYLTSYATRNTISNWPGLVASNCAWVMQVSATGRLVFAYGIGGTNVSVVGTSTTVPLNTWTHIAVTRSGTTLRLFVNGVQDATSPTVSGTLNNNPSPLYIGVLNPGESQYWLGNISNARVVKGVAVYTTGFTPSTLPLPATQSANVYGNPSAAITGTQTSLLMNFTNLGMQNNTTFADISTITATPTVTGTPYYAGLTPFTNTYPGSINFGATGRYITTPTNTAYSFGTGDFTVEFWLYPTNSVNASALVGVWSGVAATSAWLFTRGNGDITRLRFGFCDGSAVNFVESSTGAIANNVWQHIVAVRSGGTFRMYVNGTQVYSASNSLNIHNPSTVLAVMSVPSSSPTFDTTGYVSNLRIVKGVGVYTSAFTPSTLPLPATQSANTYGNPSAAITGTQTSLLIPGTTGGFQDLSNSGQRITNTTSTTSVKTVSATQQFKFGTQSNTLLPTAYQTVIDDTTIQFGTNDFTIEGWVYTNAAGVVYGLINKGASTPTGWSLEINASNQLVWYSAGTAIKTSTTTIPASTWTYVAITRNGTNLYMFINGTLQGTVGTDSANYNQTNNMIIGATRALGNGLNGYLDDLRITRYTARYTASFTAPTAAFPTTPGPSVEYLIVGGGGGGGGLTGAGGGAGGVLTGTFNNITAQAYTVTVGLGGAGGTGGNQGANGNVSTFNSFSSAGGGGGGTNNNGSGVGPANGRAGGSGGGASNDAGGNGTVGAGNTPSTSPSQGNNGGIAYVPWGTGGVYVTGGGGGASAVGANATVSKAGDGGAGVSSSISGTAVTYGGGGGGGAYRISGTADAGGLGGAGGGGRGYGSSLFPAASGTPNTGGGGGGQGQNSGSIAGSGGSGIVIIRYLTNGTNGVSNTSTGGTKTTSGAYTIHTFTSSGTFTAVLT